MCDTSRTDPGPICPTSLHTTHPSISHMIKSTPTTPTYTSHHITASSKAVHTHLKVAKRAPISSALQGTTQHQKQAAGSRECLMLAGSLALPWGLSSFFFVFFSCLVWCKCAPGIHALNTHHAACMPVSIMCVCMLAARATYRPDRMHSLSQERCSHAALIPAAPPPPTHLTAPASLTATAAELTNGGRHCSTSTTCATAD